MQHPCILWHLIIYEQENLATSPNFFTEFQAWNTFCINCSWNHGLVLVGRNIKAHPLPNPLPWAATPSTCTGFSDQDKLLEIKIYQIIFNFICLRVIFKPPSPRCCSWACSGVIKPCKILNLSHLFFQTKVRRSF